MNDIGKLLGERAKGLSVEGNGNLWFNRLYRDDDGYGRE
jgi:hypothetical protein